LISHGNIVSVCDFNSEFTQEKQWRHLIPKDDGSFQSEISYSRKKDGARENGFSNSDEDIRLMKLREESRGGMEGFDLRVVVLYKDN